jgi:opacity protein-like surface antigen
MRPAVGASPMMRLVLVASMAVAAGAADAQAQGGFGVGGRFSFIRGDAPVGDSVPRYFGGHFRAKASRLLTFELAVDYRSHLDLATNERVVDYPVHGSLLFYPVRAGFAPYLLGGVGFYTPHAPVVAIVESDTLAPPVKVTGGGRDIGYHGGIGVDLRLGRHAAAHVEYRYTHVRFGDFEEGDGISPGAVPLPGSIALQKRMKLSHAGSMVATGLTFYF